MSSEITRRVMLSGLGGLLSATAFAKPESAPLPCSRTPLSLRLDFEDGKNLSFTETAAEDIGDYTGPFVRQKCFRQRAGGNGDYRDGFTVFFRLDYGGTSSTGDGKRHEIVIEYGTEVDFSGQPPKPARGIAAAHAPPCTAAIVTGAAIAPVKISVPAHRYGTRWRWQSSPRPIVRGYNQLVAMRAILPLDRGLLYGAAVPQERAWKGPMDTAGLAPGMGAPGDRTDIGPVTEHMAAFLLTGDKGCETTWRAQAEATGSMPFWVRDAATGNFVDPKVRLKHGFQKSAGREITCFWSRQWLREMPNAPSFSVRLTRERSNGTDGMRLGGRSDRLD